jgi:hypothetical protein
MGMMLIEAGEAWETSLMTRTTVGSAPSGGGGVGDIMDDGDDVGKCSYYRWGVGAGAVGSEVASYSEGY